MMNEPRLGRSLPDQSSGSGRSFGTPRHQSVTDPIRSKRVCFYKSGDAQFSGLRMVINNRTFNTFDALLDSLSKKVPLPFGVRNITTPHGVHAVHTLDELEDGKSYICSDMRKVKPINLALVRRKLPPWYHARPVSSRRRTVHQSRSFPGQKIHRKERAVLRTPKRLVVFCNGVPAVHHTLVLDKRITPTFETILEYISEVVQFHVVKLHMLDGRRVDGLPGLILCSGVVVAAGREPFRAANYNTQTPAPPAMLTSNQASLRRLKSLNRKKKVPSHTRPMSRRFSSSSERYMVDRIHDSIAASSFDLPSNPANSASLESGHVLESVVEGDAEGQDCVLPTEDDIEKSFRVNQDGSMTVEMKVRLTIKEEETVHWTTTLSRSSAASQTNGNSLAASEAEPVHSVSSQSLESQSPAAATDAMKNDTSEENDEEPLLQCNGALSDSIHEDAQTSPQRTPAPGHLHIRQKQASVESTTSVSAEGISEGTITSFSYKEETEHAAVAEQYCMFKQKTTKPVPKPRRFGSVDGNSRNVSTLESAGTTDCLQIGSSREEVTEAVFHIYEQQTRQDNFLADLSGDPFSSGIKEPQPEIWRPATACESISMWRAESMSLTSDLPLPTVKTGEIQARDFSKPADRAQRRDAGKNKRTASKPKVTNKHGHIMSAAKRQKRKSTEKTRKQTQDKPLSGAGLPEQSYGSKVRSSRSTKVGKQQTSPMDDQSEQRENRAAPLRENKDDVPNASHQPSVHQGKKSQNEEESTSLPTFDSLGSAADRYVEKWLEQSQRHTYEDSKRAHVAKVVKQLETPSEAQTSPAPKTDLFPDNVRRASVKQRILSFETKSSSSSVEKKASQHQTTDTDAKLWNISARSNPGEIHAASSHRQENLPHAQKMSAESDQGTPPSRTSLGNATPSRSLSTDLPSLPPPPAETDQLSYDEEAAIPSETSGMFSRVSSEGGQRSDQPSPGSPASDSPTSPVDQTSETTTSAWPDGASSPPSGAPSTKRVALVSNVSFDRKMSLRKSRLDKYTPSCDETLPAPNAAHLDMEPRAAHLTGEAPVQENGPSRGSSAYAASVESEGRTSTGSLSSSEPSAPSAQSSATPATAGRQQAPPDPEPPHSGSLDTASAAVRRRLGGTPPGRNHSLEKADVAQRRTSKGKSEHPPQTAPCTADPSVSNQTEKQVRGQPYRPPSQPAEELCVSLKSIRQMLQSRRASCLERSNSLPDFSSGVASLFGSSSNALLAFLSAITLKDGVARRHGDELRANAVSCTEALKMIHSLREIAAVEDCHQFNDRLLTLQQSASKQLMESWESFQEFSRKSKSCSSTPDSEAEFGADHIISEIVDNLDLPEELRVELASLSEDTSDGDASETIGDVGGTEDSSEVEGQELLKEERGTVPEEEGSGSEAEKQGGRAAPGEEPDGSGHVNGAGADSSDLECPSEEEEEPPAHSCYVELTARTSSVEAESAQVSNGAFSETTGLSNSHQERRTQTEPEASVADGSAAEEPDSEEGLAEHQSAESKAVVQNALESPQEAQEEDITQHSQTRKDQSSLITSRPFSADEDSGNDHSMCEASAETQTPQVEEELSYYGKDWSSEPTVNGYSSRGYRLALLDAQSDGETCENVAKQVQDPSTAVLSQTIAERVSLLEKLVAEAQRSRRTTVRCSSQRSPLLQVDGGDSECPTPASALTRSAPQSSLSFSYDSSGVITTEPERTSVKSIREMFLAKSVPEPRPGNGTTRRQLPDLRAETSVSGGYQSQTSSDASSAEDEAAQRAIRKGFVRKTIERLYGKRDVQPEQEAGERPPSAPTQKKKDHSRIFSPFHNIGSKAGSELSYFSSPSELDTSGEDTKRVAFKAQVRPGESVPSENGPFLMGESVSDPAGIDQSITSPPQAAEIMKDAGEVSPYSLFELQDKNSAQRKCTYFSLPHASEPDVCQDELSPESGAAANGDTVADTKEQSKHSKPWAERNGVLPAVAITDWKKMDNKVHPLVELPPDGQVVVAQPVRGHGVVNRRAPEPDVLDLLYNFCGQNCPIL